MFSLFPGWYSVTDRTTIDLQAQERDAQSRSCKEMAPDADSPTKELKGILDHLPKGADLRRLVKTSCLIQRLSCGLFAIESYANTGKQERITIRIRTAEAEPPICFTLA